MFHVPNESLCGADAVVGEMVAGVPLQRIGYFLAVENLLLLLYCLADSCHQLVLAVALTVAKTQVDVFCLAPVAS